MSSKPGRLDLGVARGHQHEHPLAADHVVDQRNRALLPDREGDRRFGEDDGVLEGEDRKGRREVELLAVQAGEVETHVGHTRLHRDRHPASRGRGARDGQRDSQDSARVLGAGAARVDVLRESHLALERAVLDLHLLVDPALRLRAFPLARDDEHAFAHDDGDALGVDAGKLDDHRQLVRIVGVVAVDVRAEAAARRAEARPLPEVGEQRLELVAPSRDVASRHQSTRYRHH